MSDDLTNKKDDALANRIMALVEQGWNKRVATAMAMGVDEKDLKDLTDDD